MSDDQIQLIIKMFDDKFNNLEKFLRDLKKDNDQDHNDLKEYHKIQNGYIAKNSDARVRHSTHFKWIYGIIVLLLIPITLSFLIK